MLGAIIGDTVGSVYEFHNTRNYDFPMFSEETRYTDDSLMTVAVAWWLLNDPEFSHQGLEDAILRFEKAHPDIWADYGMRFSDWLYNPKRLPSFDAGNGPLPYISRTGRHPYGSFGNGSAMRVSAVGWFFDTLAETERVARISAEITHNHPEGIKGAQATAAAILLARTGKSKDEIRDYVEKTYGYDLHKTLAYWRPIYDWDESCRGTVPQAMICFLESDNFEDAIRKAVSLGGDSDTLACITGGIAEAFYKDIPAAIANPVLALLPEEFKTIMTQVRARG